MHAKTLGLVAAAALLAATAAAAHHSPLAVFNMNSTTTTNGVVSKIVWVNPHVYFEVEGKDKAGNDVTYKFESQPPAFFVRAGLRSADLKAKIGKKVVVTHNPARDGSALGWAKFFKFDDGTTMQLGTPVTN